MEAVLQQLFGGEMKTLSQSFCFPQSPFLLPITASSLPTRVCPRAGTAANVFIYLMEAMGQRAKRTPAPDSRAELLISPQAPYSLVKREHLPSCPSLDPRGQPVFLPLLFHACPTPLQVLLLVPWGPACSPFTPLQDTPQFQATVTSSLGPHQQHSMVLLPPYYSLQSNSTQHLERPTRNMEQMPPPPCLEPFSDSSPQNNTQTLSHSLRGPRIRSCLLPTSPSPQSPRPARPPPTPGSSGTFNLLLPPPARPFPGSSSGGSSSFVFIKALFRCDSVTPKPHPVTPSKMFPPLQHFPETTAASHLAAPHVTLVAVITNLQ